ncbi:MAG: PAS domain S-box protein [Chlorobiaceae bacterium]|nr:PAS domain S-box protein [Chlorobiaceae bacterium]NTV98447.1 PAS domain S-box protein [Chlorobiaceae bacterium]
MVNQQEIPQNLKDLTYRIVFEESDEAKFIIDRNGIILIANRVFSEHMGIQVKDCLGQDVFSLLPRELADERKKHIEEAFRTGKRLLFEDERKSRHYRNSLYPVQGENSETDKLYIFSQDITELKHAETQSTKHTAFSREAMEAFPGSYTILDTRGKIISCNSYFRDVITGKSDDDLSGFDTFSLFHPDDKPLASEKLIAILQNGTEESAELRILIKGGPEYRWFRISTKRIIVGNELFLVSSGTDIDAYKKTEQELSMSNELLRFILAQSRTGSWEWNLKTGSSKWSDEVWKLYGIEKNAFEPSYENWKALVFEEDRENVERQLREVSGKSSPFKLEVRTRHSDGSLHWLLIHAIPFMDVFGNISRFVGSIIDITDLKESEQMLRESEGRFRRLFQEHSSVMLIIDAETDRIIDANSAAELFYGWNAKELCSMTIEHLSAVPPETIPKEKAAIDLLSLIHFPSVHRKADGSIRDVEVFCTPDVIGNKRIYYVTINDVTDRKRAEEKLKKLSVAVEQSPAAVVITDPEGNIEYANPAFCDLTGYSFEETIGQNPRILKSGMLPKEFYENLWNTILAGQVWYGEFHNRKKNDELYWENAVISAIRNEEGTISNYVAVKEDITEKKKLWNQLLDSKSKLEAALESMSDAVIICDPDGRFIEFNSAFATFHRFRNKEEYLTSLTDYPAIFDLFKPDGTPVPFEQWPLPRALSGETGIAVDYTVTRKDTGAEWTGSYSFAPIRDNNGRITGSVVTARDITHLKKAEETLRESEERFRKFFEQHSAAMMILDPETGNIVDVNDASSDFYGWSREQLLRMNVITLNIDTPEESRKRLEGWKHTDRRTFTVRHRIADGSICDIEIFGQKIRLKDRYFAYLILHDITERKKFQEALVESNERIHYILNAANAGIWEADLTTYQSYWSDELWLLHGVEPNSFPLTFDYMANTVLPEDRHSYEKAISDAVKNAAELNTNWRIKDARGNIRWLMAKGNPVRDGNDNAVKYVGIVLDISRQKMMEEENRQLEKRIQKSERLETIGTLAGGIAHDFNNILTPIMGYAEMGLMKLPQEDPLHEYFTEIMLAADRAQNIVSQILTFGRATESDHSLVSVQAVIDEALKLLRPTIPSTITIDQHIDNSCMNILADPSKIHQVIVNLCTNSYHAMEETGGTLSITLCEIVPDSNLLKILPELHEHPYVKLTISDTGCGMDKLTMDHIFEPFFTTKPVNKGTGLGLSVVHGIITGYKGIISVESRPGKGSSFRIFLPVVDDAAPRHAEENPVSSGNASVLFVDDEQATLKMMTIMLTKLGYRIRALHSPLEAIELFRKSPGDFDLVITDLTMPEMTGLNFAVELHKIRPGFPVILMTGYGKDIGGTTTLEKYGIRCQLKKPVRIESIVSAIKEVYSNQQQ